MLPIDHDHPLQRRQTHLGLEHAREELLLGEDDPAVGDLELVPDLLRGGCVVDRERDRAHVDRGKVDHVALGDVGQQHRHRVTLPDAERDEAAGELADALGQL